MFLHCHICHKRMTLSSANQYDGKYYCNIHFLEARIEKINTMKTVKARMALVINEEGSYVSAGWNGASDEELMSAVLNEVAGDNIRYIVTVELEIPEEKKTKEVTGKAERIGE